MKNLTFKKFQKTNYQRSKSDVKHSMDWNALEFMGACVGELGEAANLIKKLRRGDKINKKDIGWELADTITYIGLIASNLNIDLESHLIEKFNIVSKRHSSKYKL